MVNSLDTFCMALTLTDFALRNSVCGRTTGIRGLARNLLETLKRSATTQKVIRLRCRRDFSANSLWPKFGFVPIDERPGRSKEGHLLTLWRLVLAPDDQFALFRANVSDTILDVVMDAQIFFDFDRQGQ